MSAKYTVGHMNQLGDALEDAGFSPDDVTMLRSYPDLKSFKKVLLGHAKIVVVEHVIDLDADPYIPSGWKAEEHIKGGQFVYDPAKIDLYLSKSQKKGSIVGHDLRKELQGKPVYNANLLDFWVVHPELIPDELKGKYVFFWGTIYRRLDDLLYVRYLSWAGSKWLWASHWLDHDWDNYSPAALAKK